MIGQLLSGRYRIIRTLAAGGMGQTYIAEDIQRPGNPRCVVKQLKPASGNTGFLATARRLFSREAEILEQLGYHDQIPRLLAYFEQDHEFYVIQEFIDGRPLSAEFALEPRWSEAQVIQFLQEILHILKFVHSQNVIHRDIKPDNLIRRRRDSKFVLIDFGAVKQVRIQQPNTAGQTNITISIGTPGYMPTEQSKGRPCPSSDIYALGMIAIRALTGVHPTELLEDDDGEVVWRDRVEVSDELAAILTKMVRYYYKRRYQSAAEALIALEAVAGDPTTGNRFNGHPHNSSTPTASNGHASAQIIADQHVAGTHPIVAPPFIRSELGDDISTFISATAPIGAEPPSFTPVEFPSVPLDPPPRKWKRIGIAIAAVGLLAGGGALGYWYWQQRQPLPQLQTLKSAGKYDECIRQAKILAAQGNILVKSSWGECQLAKAQQAAEKGRFKDAITLAGDVISGTEAYRQAQRSINQWAQQILKIADKEYQNGNLDTAIAIAKTVPENNQFSQSAQESIERWQQEWQTNQKYISTAQRALDKKDWLAAIDAARQVTTSYWEGQAAYIIQVANAALAAAGSRQDLPPQFTQPQLTTPSQPLPSRQSDYRPPRSQRSTPTPSQEDAPIFEVPNQSNPEASPQPSSTPEAPQDSTSGTPTQTPAPGTSTPDSPMIEVPDIFK